MAKNEYLNEKLIHLDELPEDGKDYVYTNESAELNQDLKDLLGERAYKLEFSLRPAGNAYEMIGTVETTLPLLCSRCAIDLEYSIKEKFHEILIVNEPLGRGHKNGSTNHMSDGFDGGPFCNYLDKEELDVAQFAHEIIALAEPARPLGNPNCLKSCENYDNAINNGWVTPVDAVPATNAFEALKDLKLPDRPLSEKN